MVELCSENIDRSKWDAVVSKDPRHKVYGMSWFLDAVTDGNWRALIWDDYKAVMPFVVKRKFGISYCYMPMFAQQFSVYGMQDRAPDFIRMLRKSYNYAELCMTDAKPFAGELIEKSTKNNLVLPLYQDYPTLYTNYTKKHQASISKYRNEGFTYEMADDIIPLLEIFRKEKKEIYSFSQMEELMSNVEKIYTAACNQGLTRLYHAKENGKVIGGAFFLLSNQRIYYFFGISKKQESKTNGTSFILLDRLIKEYSGSDYTLDFEGSDNPGIAHFFKGFGAMSEPYFMVKWNDLPFFIKWIKR